MTVNPGDLINITIKGVRVVNRSSVHLQIADEHGDVFDMPPQAAIEHASTGGEDPVEQDDRIVKVLAVLDNMEAEGYIQPYVAARAREVAGLPPRHWPPQPGDVWTEENPFSPLWFAQLSCGDGNTDLVMAPLEGGPKGLAVRTPDELLTSSCQLALAYRKDGSR
ncbi:hypothetical protein [Streptosporangium sp. NPDC049078]|uniref:hypothetical protein n=1 Tax=Streptosporangium sp. NPDC049078 TaxID=3155767 RepID=UPI00343A3736